MRRPLILIAACCLALAASAQSDDKVTLSGSVQSDMLLPQSDSDIGAEKTED